MSLTRRARALRPSPTIALSTTAKRMQAEGIDVIDLTVGEPDFDTPEHVKAAGIRAIRDGRTKYTASGGIVELKDAIRTKLKRENGLEYGRDEVLVSCGSKHSLYNLAAVLFEAGDEVIVPAPYWVSYPEQVRLFEATPVIVPTREDDGFRLTRGLLEAALTPRTRAVILNSPCNPTGAVLERPDLEAIADLACARDCWLISDEAYEVLVYDGAQHTSIAALGDEVKRRTVGVYTMSKAYAMTGWRIGYAAGPSALINAMDLLQGQQTSGACSIAQWAAVEALEGPQDHLAVFRKAFEERRDLVVSMLNQAKYLKCPTPEGAFYVFPSCADAIGRKTPDGKVIETDEDFVTELLGTQGVAVVQGSAFGVGPNFRVSYAASNALLEDACRKIQAFCGSLI